MDSDMHKGAGPVLFSYARQNRRKPTEAEQVLWNCLRNRRLKGVKFRRQHPLGEFVVDFYSVECNLVVEVDGDYHNDTEQAKHDAARTEALEKLDVRVIRVKNEDVIGRLEEVLAWIERNLIPSHLIPGHLIPGPSPGRRREIE